VNAFDPTRPTWYLHPTWRSSEGPATPVEDPATGERVGVRAQVTAPELAGAVARANEAQRAWRDKDARERAALLHRVADAIERTDLSRCAELLTREMGKPYPESLGELANCASPFRYFAEMARDEAGKVAGTTQAGSFQYARYEPLGVSVHVLPFNFPLLLACWTVSASLAAGNACLLKPAPATTLSTLEFMRVFAALPDGLVACLPGDAAVASALIESPDTHAVAFTGSVAAARQVAAAAGARLKPAVIEAGGSDPLIVSASAPLDVAADGAVTAAFHLSGQVCTSAERLFVVDGVHDEFVREFAARTARLRVGPGLERSEIGPLVSRAARDRIARLVDDARAQGAVVVTGGRVPPGRERGWFYEPTVLTGVTSAMAIVREECFGPVAAITRVPDFESALAAANATPFGLGASVFTTRLDEAMAAAERLEAGMVWVNNPLIDNDALPFGGWKSSGVGRSLSRLGLDAFRRSKMVVIDAVPRRQDWWYPYPDAWFRGGPGRD
jgi:acyl-CoA reductase-like NAD-dependent aldehyde dehydrogenase